MKQAREKSSPSDEFISPPGAMRKTARFVSWRRLGIIVFWLAWPLLFFYFKLSDRTRLLLVCGDEILVVRGWFGNAKWGLPGGGLHRGEQPVAGVLREVREETGIELQPAQIKPLLVAPYRDKGFRFTCHYFVIQLDHKPNVTIQKHELNAAAWLSMAQLTLAVANPDVLTACVAWSDK